MLAVISKKPEETFYIGQRMAKFLKAGDLISLTGDLGAGKTCFVQGLAKGLEINEQITSPTFILIHEYQEGRLPLYHMDVYRLQSPEEMDNLGYEEYFYGQGITVVEWGNLITEILPKENLWLDFKLVPEGREIVFHPSGERYQELVKELTGYDYSSDR